MVSAVLALHTILTGYVPRCKVVVLGETRSTTNGLLLHARLTESTSNTYGFPCMTYREHFQY